MQFGFIYKATLNNKIYIGQSLNFNRRKKDHKSLSFNENSNDYNSHFHRAIRKYGYENIKWEILEQNVPEELLNIKECEWIQGLKSNKIGYNMTIGGDGLGSGKNHPLYGKKRPEFSEEHRFKISQSHLGKVTWNKGKTGVQDYSNRKRNPLYKLTFKIAQQIREIYNNNKVTHKFLAEKFNVDRTTISNILSNKIWSK